MVKSDLWNSSRPQTNPGLNQGVKQKEEAQPIFLNLRLNPENIDKQNIVFLPHHFSTFTMFFLGGVLYLEGLGIYNYMCIYIIIYISIDT